MKKRFGVSIDESTAGKLEVLSSQTGLTRSKLVEEAIKGYLEDHSHLIVPHDCRGILIAHCPSSGLLTNLAEDYREIIVAWLHAHFNRECMEAFFVEGPSSSIRDLYSKILRKGCAGRYIPAGSISP